MSQPTPHPTAPPDAKPSSRVRRMVVRQPNLRLDPQGLSGTQTARRIQNARRRRQLQTFWVSALAISLVVSASTLLGMKILGITPTFAQMPTRKIADLPFGAQGRATLDASGTLWVQSGDATLWKIGRDGHATKIFSATFPARPAPLVAQNAVVLATQDGKINVLDARTGKRKWSRDLGASISARPILVPRTGLADARSSATLVCGDDQGQVVALDFQSGALLWARQLGAPLGEGMALANQQVLVPTLAGQNTRGGLVALNARTGQLSWRFPAQTTVNGAGVCVPFYDASSNRVFWANDEGTVLCLNAQNGTKIWKTFAAPLAPTEPRPPVLRGCPALIDGALLVGGEDGVLRAFNAQNGLPRWATPLGSPVQGPVQGASELSILARTTNSEAFVLGLSGGEILRHTPFSASGVWGGKNGFDFRANGEFLRLG